MNSKHVSTCIIKKIGGLILIKYFSNLDTQCSTLQRRKMCHSDFLLRTFSSGRLVKHLFHACCSKLDEHKNNDDEWN